MADAGALPWPRGPRHRCEVRDQEGAPCAIARLIKIFDQVFATKPLAEWRAILDGNGLVFGVVGILDDIPNDKQMIENEVLVPFENDTMLTISSPIWVDGSKKVQPRKPPGLGEHSDEILRNAGYDEAAIEKLRASGAVA